MSGWIEGADLMTALCLAGVFSGLTLMLRGLTGGTRERREATERLPAERAGGETVCLERKEEV